MLGVVGGGLWGGGGEGCYSRGCPTYAKSVEASLDTTEVAQPAVQDLLRMVITYQRSTMRRPLSMIGVCVGRGMVAGGGGGGG